MKTMLFIDGLEVFANHGLFEEENKLGQKFIFDRFPEIENIKLKINKPAAPVRHHFEKCGVEVKISREEFYRL